MQNAGQPSQWHTAQWGMWGWFETILKLIGVVAGILAFAASNAASPLAIGDNPHLAALILLALLALGALAQVGIRFTQRETISFAFAILNLVGHLALLVAVLRVPDQPTLAMVFGGCYALGQLVKLQFLRATGYTEGGANTTAMLGVAALMAILYALLAVLMLF